MPMQWDTAADAKLFAAVVRVFDVKLANGVGEKLAKLMGPGTLRHAPAHVPRGVLLTKGVVL